MPQFCVLAEDKQQQPLYLLNFLKIVYIKLGIKQGLSKKYLTLSPPAKNNAMPAKWFWKIVTTQLLPMHKKIQTNSCVIFFF